MKGLGSALWFSRYFMITLLSSATLLKAPRRIRFRVISAKKRPTMLSQDAEVGCEVQVEAGMPLEPALHRGGFMSGIVVDDEMKGEIGRGLLIDQLEKTQELAVPMARHASPMTLPFSMFKAAKRVVVPFRL